jgi:tetratricopeptide (TPR) repeat protein
MKARLWSTLLVAVLASAAYAGGVEDGNAGLQALNSGAYDEAIRLFTRALRPSELTGDDREFAYLNRGKAYVAKGDFDHAIADFKQALRLKPDDNDAQDALQAALTRQSGGDDADAAPSGGSPGDPWGLLSAMATQQYYWYEVPGHDPHEAYVRFSWYAPQQALSVSIRNKSDQLFVAEYKLEPKTGQIIYAALSGGAEQYGTLKAGAASAIGNSFQDGAPVRFLTRRQADGSVTQTQQNFVNGAWSNGVTIVMAPTSVDELTTDGLIKAKKH